jgi:type I restriction enzyme M protein
MPRGRPKNSGTDAPSGTVAKAVKPNGNGAKLDFEAQLFLAADKLRKNLEPSDYKHVALGLIFLKYISNAFESKRAALLAEDAAAAEDPDEYLAERVFWVPKKARWSHLQANAKQPTIGKLIDEAMAEIERANLGLKGVLPKDYNRPALDKVMLGELIDLVSGIGMGEPSDKAKDILGRVYEYFLGGFAGSEGKRGGEFYTPRSVVRVLVAMLEPYKGRVYDPCCGSGGMFVQSERFVESHGGRIGDIAIYGQESNYTTWRLCKMNLAVRGIDADICWNNEGSSTRTNSRTCASTTSLPIRRSTFQTGAASGCERMRAGPMACRRSATPATLGLSIFSGISHRTALRG